MRCPICNARMPKKMICPYCKVRGEQVIYGSNIEAKKLIKEKFNEEVVFSKTRPYDVSKTTMLLLTIFLGVFGVHNYYVGRIRRGIIFNIGVGTLILFSTLIEINQRILQSGVLLQICEIGGVLGAVIVACWILDIFAVWLGYFKYPVKIATLEEVKYREKKYE